MTVLTQKVTFPCDLERLWELVTSLDAYGWRSDLDRIEILSDTQFVEYTTDGLATTFTTTVLEPCTRWEFDLENDNITGHWHGLFSQRDGQAHLELTESVAPKRFFLRPFVKGYLKKQQARYVADLKRALERSKEGG